MDNALPFVLGVFMNPHLFPRSAVIACLLSIGAAHAQPAPMATVGGDSVVLRAGSVALTKAEYESLVPGFARASGAPLTGADHQSLKSGQEVARLLTLAEEAKRRGIDQDPEVAALMRVRGYVLLTNALFAKLTAEVKKDEAGTRALWELRQGEFAELTARQILIRHKGAATDKPGAKGTDRSEAQAGALASRARARIASGMDFASAARMFSDEESTRSLGGQLPPFTRGATVSEFEAVAFNLAPGAVSEPFKSKYGFHIVQLVERRPFAFERVRATLEFARAREMIEKIGATGIDLNAAYFKP